VLYSDGVMESYYGNSLTSTRRLRAARNQAWAFGPKILDNGQIPASYNTTDVIISLTRVRLSVL
jgi:hypothetical protein